MAFPFLMSNIAYPRVGSKKFFVSSFFVFVKISNFLFFNIALQDMEFPL